MPQRDTDLNPRMVAYIRRHLHDSAPTPEEPPIWWKPGAVGELAGTLNQKWLARACWLLWRPAEAIEACIAAYRAELQGGHRLQEEMSVSHDAEWLNAHYAIRTWCRGRAADESNPQLDVLWQLNTAWCGAELALAREFYLPAIGVLCPAARFEGVLVSPQRSVLAAWDAIPDPTIKGARRSFPAPANGRQFNDTYCLELAHDLVLAGDDLGRSVAKIPKLTYPIRVELKAASIRAHWSPGREVLKPVFYVEWPTSSLWPAGDQAIDGWVLQKNGLPKGKPAAGSTLPVSPTGSFKQIG